MSNIDEYCEPLILQSSKAVQETIYSNCLKYAKILCGDESPWCDLSLDIRRADLHTAIAGYCDCDKELVEEAFDKVFVSLKRKEGVDFYRRPIDDNFLKLVDNWVDELKELAKQSEEERFPSFIPKILNLN